jgi:hypothetical protein
VSLKETSNGFLLILALVKALKPCFKTRKEVSKVVLSLCLTKTAFLTIAIIVQVYLTLDNMEISYVEPEKAETFFSSD